MLQGLLISPPQERKYMRTPTIIPNLCSQREIPMDLSSTNPLEEQTSGISTLAIRTFSPVSRDLYNDTSMPSYEVEVWTTLSKLVATEGLVWLDFRGAELVSKPKAFLTVPAKSPRPFITVPSSVSALVLCISSTIVSISFQRKGDLTLGHVLSR